MIKISGKHLTVDMYGCKSNALNNIEFIRTAMLTALKESNLTLLNFTYHQFDSQRVIAVAILEESHMNIHTYPELSYAAIDIFTCGDPSRADKAVALLKNFLKPERTKITNIRRGDFISESDIRPKIKISIAPLRRVRSTGARVLRFLSRTK
ncbi:MAG: S-adenosylmethionine decarboxylase proenzyme [Firmicutes bacterium]|nr:S-adenosylmethionine decarboxylase proenzyme [Bacillota bacterium]